MFATRLVIGIICSHRRAIKSRPFKRSLRDRKHVVYHNEHWSRDSVTHTDQKSFAQQAELLLRVHRNHCRTVFAIRNHVTHSTKLKNLDHRGQLYSRLFPLVAKSYCRKLVNRDRIRRQKSDV